MSIFKHSMINTNLKFINLIDCCILHRWMYYENKKEERSNKLQVTTISSLRSEFPRITGEGF